MKRWLRVVVNIFVWACLLAYLVFAARYCSGKRELEELSEVRVTVMDRDSIEIVSEDMIREWIGYDALSVQGILLDTLDTETIRRTIASHPFIKSVGVFSGMDGVLNIEATQRQPIMRVVAEGGFDFYVSDDMWILPADEAGSEYVPMVTGRFTLPFSADYHGSLEGPDNDDLKKTSEDYRFLFKLINFVRLTSADDFWNAWIVQIDVSKPRPGSRNGGWREPEIELVPRVGSHVVAFGTLTDVERKLEKLMLFYRNVLDYEGWDMYRLVSVKYDGQVVCRK